jgi:hypothetical protein
MSPPTTGSRTWCHWIPRCAASPIFGSTRLSSKGWRSRTVYNWIPVTSLQPAPMFRLPHLLDVDLVERHEFLHRRLTTVAEFEPAQCLHGASRGAQVAMDGRESFRKRGRTPKDRPHHFKARARDRNKAEEWRSRQERIAPTLISHQLLGDLPRRRILRPDLASARSTKVAANRARRETDVLTDGSFQLRRVNELTTYPVSPRTRSATPECGSRDDRRHR